MKSRETLQVSARITDTVLTGQDFAVAFPFLPDRLAADPGYCCDPAQAHGYVASDAISATFGGGSVILRLSADEAGIVDLDSLQILAGLETNVADYRQNVLASVLVRRITLPSGEQLVTGITKGGAPVAAPGAAFAHYGRSNAWVHFGQVVVDEDDVIEIEVETRANAGTPTRFSVGARFYAAHDEGQGGAIRGSGASRGDGGVLR